MGDTSGPSVPFAAGRPLSCVDVRKAGVPLYLGGAPAMEAWLARGPRELVLERHSVDYSHCRAARLGLSPQDAWAFLSQSLPTLNGITMYT